MGLNKHTYETRYKVLDMNVLERENLTKYEVHLKIDNLNVEDMFDHNRTEKLLDIFRSVAKTSGAPPLILQPYPSSITITHMDVTRRFLPRVLRAGEVSRYYTRQFDSHMAVVNACLFSRPQEKVVERRRGSVRDLLGVSHRARRSFTLEAQRRRRVSSVFFPPESSAVEVYVGK